MSVIISNSNQKLENTHNYGIDLLRILSMLFVVILHILLHGNALLPQISTFVSDYILWGWEAIAFCATNIFAMISGYVSIYSNFKISRWIRIWLQVFFYSVLISLIMYLVKSPEIQISTLIRAFFPVLSGQYWYFTSYTGMFFLIPILNLCIKKMPRTGLKVALLLIVFGAQFVFKSEFWGINNGCSTLWLCIMYVLGGYIRYYNVDKRIKIKKAIILLILVYLAMIFSRIIIHYVTIYFFGRPLLVGIFYNYLSFPCIVSAALLLCIFSQIKIKKDSKIIQKLSSASFGVYLIHEHPLMIPVFFENRFVWFTGTWISLIVIPLIALCVYVICALIELFRIKLFEKLKITSFFKCIDYKFSCFIEK